MDTGEAGVEGVSDESLHDHNASDALRVIRVRTTRPAREYLTPNDDIRLVVKSSFTSSNSLAATDYRPEGHATPACTAQEQLWPGLTTQGTAVRYV